MQPLWLWHSSSLVSAGMPRVSGTWESDGPYDSYLYSNKGINNCGASWLVHWLPLHPSLSAVLSLSPRGHLCSPLMWLIFLFNSGRRLRSNWVITNTKARAPARCRQCTLTTVGPRCRGRRWNVPSEHSFVRGVSRMFLFIYLFIVCYRQWDK